LPCPAVIFISGKVYDDIKNQKDIHAVSLGKYTLKNVKDEIEIYAISNPAYKFLKCIAWKARVKSFAKNYSCIALCEYEYGRRTGIFQRRTDRRN
jgi:hypothetical protein